MSISYRFELAEQQLLPVVVVGDRYEEVTYEAFVCNLVKECGTLRNNLTHMVLGVAGESGELVDAIKKHVIYGKPLDRDNVIEELGDLEFYMAGMRQMLGYSRSYILEANMLKLGKRYTSGYSDAAAIARVDKVEPAAAEALGQGYTDADSKTSHYEKLAKLAQEQRPATQPAAELFDSQQVLPVPSNPVVGFPPLSR